MLLPILALSLTIRAEPLDDFIQNLVEQHDFQEKPLRELLEQAKIQQSILDIMARPPGKVVPWHEYRTRFVNEKRIADGLVFWKQHKKTLELAEKNYGVPAAIIVSIIGIETHYGKQTGKHRVLDALSTLAFHYPKRADFFQQELIEFLLLTREYEFAPLKLQGSYAGAMGIGQFMPGSYRKFAVDFDKDGKARLWEVGDTIGSVAHYLQQHGWERKQPIVIPAKISQNADDALFQEQVKPVQTLVELRKLGLSVKTGLADETLANLVTLDEADGAAYWLGLNNFYVITRYNKSWKYAMAVYELAKALRDGMK